MNNYAFANDLHALWQHAVGLYAKGQRGADTYFDAGQQAFLDAIGVTAQEVYDFAEDFNDEAEPDFATFAMIHDIRRRYFLEKQGGQPTGKQIDPATLPPKPEALAGVVWLPRIIAKAKAKLHGELHPDVMYSCGGDRQFLSTNNIHAGEFLRIVEDNEDNDAAIVDWVLQRRKASGIE